MALSNPRRKLSAPGIAGAVLFGAWIAGAPALWCQDTAGSQAPETKPVVGRFSFGGRLSILTDQLIKNDSVSRSTSTPPVSTTLNTNSTSSRYGGGATVQLAIVDRLALSVDVLYRSLGYNSTAQLVEGVDNPNTVVDERRITNTSERTKAEYWDVPILARVYNIGRHREGARVFVNGGVAIRYLTNVRTFREIIRPDGLSDTSETPVTPAKDRVLGVVVGGGFQLMDELGLKVMPEVRFTKWSQRTFATSPTLAPRNQLEVILGITW